MDLDHYVKPQITHLAGNGRDAPKLIIDIPRQGMRALSSSHSRISSFTKKIADHANETPNAGSYGISGMALQNVGLSRTIDAAENNDLPKPGSFKAPKARDVVVVIDPGHGGKDPGARGATGTQEKDVVLAIAKRLQAQINRQPGFRAVLTRNSDYFLSLRNRLALARKYRGDMFIAIHADAHDHVNACGVGVYALSQRGATSEAARWLAQQENQSELVGGVDLTDKDQVLKSVLLDLSQTQSITASLQMGSVLLDNLGQFAQLHHNRVEQAAFVVLKSPDIPSLLIETGFISNSAEEHRLRTPYYQDRIATALLSGIKNYFVNHPPRGSLLALHARKNYDT
ncbi:MAG: N-acetylmuramoyl-L-alanine amidase [Gammaproteobacteria bacterium]|nr:N-acetylmuramoyl-L-alanine amidase [Gammaproteobacteria bacterium]